MLNINQILDIAKSKLSNIDHCEIFVLRDLFKNYAWNRILRSDCLFEGGLINEDK